MLKRPQHSKRRIAEQAGPLADELAELLLQCALEDLAGWPGPVCLAPASSADLGWSETLLSVGKKRRYVVAQRHGNLGQRIMQVDALLRSVGENKIIMLGTDCPALDQPYLQRADAALDSAPIVLGPARDGGVVLMGSSRPWPDLAPLPWSTAALHEALCGACESSDLPFAELDERSDIDTLADLGGLSDRLRSDDRDARQALCHWLDAHGQSLGLAP